MTIEEVIAIAKTLNDKFYKIEMSQDWSDDKPIYIIQYFGNQIFEGNSWEEALGNAGWKG